jgi:hypothetical protein
MDDDDELEQPAEKPGVEVYLENLKKSRKTKKQIEEEEEEARRKIVPKPVVPGAEYLDTIPHAPWPSRAMLKVLSFILSFDHDQSSGKMIFVTRCMVTCMRGT